MQLSNRLMTIAHNVYPYRNLIDIGTDHCLVPIYLLLNEIIDKAIASDLNYGPIKEAKKNIEYYHLEDKIELRLGNGLNIINNQDLCDVIIIAGMGGRLITSILDMGLDKIKNNKRLILQPNIDEDIVRYWLCENHYEIVNENIIKDDEKFYEIIVGKKQIDKINYSSTDIKFGPVLLKDKNPIFLEKWNNILLTKKEIIKKIPDSHPNKALYLNEIKQIESIIK